jgi:hypothetical protein
MLFKMIIPDLFLMKWLACSECAPLYYSKKIAAYENSKAGPSGLSNRRIWSE